MPVSVLPIPLQIRQVRLRRGKELSKITQLVGLDFDPVTAGSGFAPPTTVS